MRSENQSQTLAVASPTLTKQLLELHMRLDGVPDKPTVVVKLEKIAFPKTLGEQSQAIRNVLKTAGKPLLSNEIGGYFKGAKKDRVSELLELLGGLGQVQALEGDRFSA